MTSASAARPDGLLDVLTPFAQARVLVVDDNEPSVALVRMALVKAGLANVSAVSDGTRAMDAIRELRPEVLLLDLHMPQVDGYTILETLQQDPHSEVAVLVLTADTTRQAAHRAFRLGAADFLTKPIDPIELTQRLRNLLHASALQRVRRQREAWIEAAADIARAIRAHDDGAGADPGRLLVERAQAVTRADAAMYLGEHVTDPARAIAAFGAESDVGVADALHAQLAASRSVDVATLLPAGTVLGGSTMVLPLADGGTRRGVLCVHRAAEQPPFLADDVPPAADFAARVAHDLGLAEGEIARQQVLISEERDRIARELHDHVIQRLFAIGMQLEALRQLADSDQLRTRIDGRVNDLNETIELIRSTIFATGGESSEARRVEELAAGLGRLRGQ
jgi:CheY-like chemotaxis protein